MPSEAYKNFRTNIKEADRLIEAYNRIQEDKKHHPIEPTPRFPDHMIIYTIIAHLCGSWEEYIENLTIDSAKFLLDGACEPSDLPKSVHGWINKCVRTSKSGIKPMELAGSGWRRIYLECVQKSVDDFHSPTSVKIAALFRANIGFTGPVFERWPSEKKCLDDFIDVRNRISHHGWQFKKDITFQRTNDNKDNVERIAMRTDNFLYEQLRGMLPRGPRPWDGKVEVTGPLQE